MKHLSSSSDDFAAGPHSSLTNSSALLRRAVSTDVIPSHPVQWMSAPRPDRRLAAILIADVVGYGHLCHIDEEGTRARLQADLQEIFEPKIAEHCGRLVKTMGDGLLVEFPSVVEAVRCAVEIQRAKVECNIGLPADRRLEFRIGINLGDVIAEGDDIHGDCVNIAHRLQGIAQPGGVVISGTVHDQIDGRLNAGYEFLGRQPLKHIANPVRAYRVLADPKDIGKTAGDVRRPIRLWRRPALVAAMLVVIGAGIVSWPQLCLAETTPSIVVLPFTNVGGDAGQNSLPDGITEDMTTDLANIPGLRVISRNAAVRHKAESIEPAQLAEELGARYILEGSVRRAGNGLRVNARLIDASGGGLLWAERFDGAVADECSLQDRVTASIAEALELRLLPEPPGADLKGTERKRQLLKGLRRGRGGRETTVRTDPGRVRDAGSMATSVRSGRQCDPCSAAFKCLGKRHRQKDQGAPGIENHVGLGAHTDVTAELPARANLFGGPSS